jgi:hypothetical protein
LLKRSSTETEHIISGQGMAVLEIKVKAIMKVSLTNHN